MDSNIRIGVFVIATRKYKVYLTPLLESFGKYFYPNHPKKKFYLFLDEDDVDYPKIDNAEFEVIKIEPLKFPEATLYRYKIFDSIREKVLSETDYVFYTDVDMLAVAPFEEEILNPDGITLVKHHGFIHRPLNGTYENRKESLAYVENVKVPYVAGAFQGGKSEHYMNMSATLAERIQKDEDNGVMAIWHDESHANWYTHNCPVTIKLLTASYCYSKPHVGNVYPPILVGLVKDFDKMRS